MRIDMAETPFEKGKKMKKEKEGAVIQKKKRRTRSV